MFLGKKQAWMRIRNMKEKLYIKKDIYWESTIGNVPFEEKKDKNK